VAAKKAEKLGVPLVFTHHTRYQEYSHYVPSLPQDLVKDIIERLLADYMQQCHHIIVPSDSIRGKLAETYGIQERVTVVPTGIHLEPFQQADGRAVREERGWGQDEVLISVGRLAEEKNWRTLLGAMPHVIRSYPNARLVILGGGSIQDDLVAYATELGVHERVEFLGTVDYDQVPAYLKAADIFAFASVTETQGLVTLEAMAAGLPVVAVDGTGTRDIVINDQEGLLTANDSANLAEALNRVLGDKELRQRLAIAAATKAQQFDSRRQSERLIEVYYQAIQDQKAGKTVTTDTLKPIFKIDWPKLLGASS
jgi:glycosyltransferase involved in cell wall biosynthesis